MYKHSIFLWSLRNVAHNYTFLQSKFEAILQGKVKSLKGKILGQNQASSLYLVIDVGNTHTVIGLFAKQSIRHNWRLATRKETTIDEILWWLQGLMLPAADKKAITGIAYASVAPSVDSSWLQALESFLGIKPQVLNYANCCGLHLAYEVPRQIGADRLCNVLGAYSLGYREGVIIDLGTATTFDVFSEYTYWGGIICPGIHSSMQALARNASKLFEVELHWPATVVGTNTEDALRTGLLHGTVGQLEYLLELIFAEKKMHKPIVIATGGLASLVKEKSKAIHRVEPDLTLMGLNYLLSQNDSKAKRKKA